jgi:hypothetical protein
MTVTQVGQAYLTGKPTIWCVWFEGTTKLDGGGQVDFLRHVISAHGLRVNPAPAARDFRSETK